MRNRHRHCHHWHSCTLPLPLPLCRACSCRDRKPCDAKSASFIRRVSRSTIKTTYTVDNQRSATDVPTLFIDHRAAEPKAAVPYHLAVGRELVDPRFASPVIYRLNVAVAAAEKKAFVLVESRDNHAPTAITSLTKEDLAQMQRASLITPAIVAQIEAVLHRVELVRKAEETLAAIRTRLGRLDATKAAVDVEGIVAAVRDLDAMVLKNLPTA